MTSQELETAREAASVGGTILKRYYEQGVAMRTKTRSSDLVSDADIESERAIVETIRQRFPDHAVLAEELHQEQIEAEHLWVIDPLDGTTNFAHRIPHFAVSIGYYHRGEPTCAVVFNPIREDWYLSQRGQGATHNGQPIRVGAETRLDQVLVGLGFYYDRGALMKATLTAIEEIFARQVHGIRRFGTASLDLCQVAVGMFGVFFEYQLAPWDFAAGRLIVEEAGGRVTDGRGEAIPIAKTSVLASNGLLHDDALEIIARNHPPRSQG